MVEAYDGMGMNDLRDDTKRVLNKNLAKDGHLPGPVDISRREPTWWRFWE
jgi:outer membrane protein assembly factor BamD